MTSPAAHKLPYSDRITHEPNKMGGKACIRGMRITASNVIGMLSAGVGIEDILTSYPDLELADVQAVLGFAAWRLQESEQFIPR